MQKENKRLSISIAKEICSCNSCMKRNYDNEGMEKRVDKIYKIAVGQMVVYMCKECLQELNRSIESIN